MNRQANRDRNNTLVGHIETYNDGRQKALDRTGRTLGYFEPKRNVTTDPAGRVLARANILTGLIYEQR